ncbi:unnamed protein product, partial [Cladocopium goreaui]
MYIVKLPQFIVLVSLTVGPQLPSWQSLFSHGLTCQGGCLPFAPWPQLLVHLQRWAAVRIEPLVGKAAEALLLVAAVEARLLRIGSGACGLALEEGFQKENLAEKGKYLGQPGGSVSVEEKTSNLWSLLPSFDPSVDSAKEYADKVKFLWGICPVKDRSMLAPRLALQCKGTAWSQVRAIDASKLTDPETGYKVLLKALETWEDAEELQTFDKFEKAFYRVVQKTDESAMSFVNRINVAFEEVGSETTVQQVRAFVMLRQSALTVEDKKRVVSMAGNYDPSAVEKAMRSLSTKVLGQTDAGRKKVYPANFVEEELDEIHYAAEEECDEEQALAMLIEEGDETALAIQEFEDQVIHVCQDSPELAMAFSTYQEARQKLRDKFRSRGFWLLRHGKGKGKNKSKKGKGPRKYQSLAERIASSTCRACGARGGGELLDELPGHDLANWQNQIGFKVSPLFLKLTAMTLPSASGTPFPGLQTEMLDAMLSGEVDASLAFEDRQLPEIKSRRPPGVMTLKEWGQLKFPEGKWRHKSFFQAYQEDPKYGKFMKEHRKLVSAWTLSFQAYVEAMDRMQEDCSKAFYQEYARQWAKAEMSKMYPKAEIEKSQGPEWELLTGGVTSRPMSTMSSPSQKRPMEEEQSQMAIEVQQKEEMITRMAILQREMDKIKADLEGQAALWKVLEEERPREVWMAPECKYWGNFSRRNMGRYHCKQTPAGDHGCAASEYWDGIFKKIETMVPRVGKRVLDDDGVLAQIQKGAPNLKVQRVEACRGTERLRLPGADADPETIPLRMTVVKDRITGQSMVLGPAEEWAALPKRQQIRKGQSAKMSLTIFGSFPKSGELETMGSDKEAGMRNLIWFKELWIISATVVRKQKLVQTPPVLAQFMRNSDLQRALNDGSFIDVDGEDFPDWEAETEGYDPSIGEPEGELSVQPPGTPNGELSNQSEPPQGVEQSENELPDYVRVPVPESVSESDGDASQEGVNREPTDDLLFGDDITMSADDRCCQFWEIEIPVENHEEHALFCAGSADESVLLVTGAKKKRVEVRLSDLSSADQQRMAVAKHKEIGAWLKYGTVRKASKGKIPEEAIMRCRWLLTWKSASPEDHPKDVSEGRKAKARLIVVGYEDPGAKVHPVTLMTLPIAPEQVTFCAFSDASFLSGKEKYAHQGGLIFVTTPELLENKRSVVAP